MQQPKRYIPILLVTSLAITVFLFLFSQLLNPLYIDWIRGVQADPFQHFISWQFFRVGPLEPFLSAPLLLYPAGVSIVFTDSIPIFALLFKSLDILGILPAAPIQYFGIWLLCCFVLQGICSYFLLRKMTKHTVIAIIGSLYFILSPIMLFRMSTHFALSAQWLILAALMLYVWQTTAQKKQWILWALLFIFSLLTHPYLFLMIGTIYIAYILKNSMLFSIRTQIFNISAHAITVLLTMFGAGYFFSGTSGTSSGYGEFSWNLLSVINPIMTNGDPWSAIFPAIQIGTYQYEGFSYLGLGILIQFAVLGVLLIQNKTSIRTSVYQLAKQHWPLILVSLGLTLFAMSHVVYMGTWHILSIPLPEFIEYRLNIFRSSGRFFWPVYYLLFLFSAIIYRYIPKKLGIALIIFCVSLQIYDIHPQIIQKKTNYQDINYTSSLSSPFWDSISSEIMHVSFVPGHTFGMYEDIAFWAMTNGLSINTMYTARPTAHEATERVSVTKAVQSGELKKDTLYILQTDELTTYITTTTKAVADIVQVDGYTTLTRK